VRLKGPTQALAREPEQVGQLAQALGRPEQVLAVQELEPVVRRVQVRQALLRERRPL